MHVHYSEEGYDDSVRDVQYSHSYKLKGMSYNVGGTCSMYFSWHRCLLTYFIRAKTEVQRTSIKFNLIMNECLSNRSIPVVRARTSYKTITFREIIHGFSKLKL